MLEEPSEVRFDLTGGCELKSQSTCFSESYHFSLRLLSSECNVPAYKEKRYQKERQADAAQGHDDSP
jgi:hypothetical protein